MQVLKKQLAGGRVVGRVWFVSRHEGAIDWAWSQGLPVDVWANHIKVSDVGADDVVMGTLPVDMIAQLNVRGVKVFFLTIPLTLAQRGIELTMEDLQKSGCYLQACEVSLGDRLI